jgi:competence protein CoiA
MKFALVDGRRQDAQPNLSANCPSCGHPMIAKCGEVRIPHWAHKSTLLCDPWWESETEWHRNWKDQFPVNWQEFIYLADNGEKHIADVRTDHGWAIEFQHSYINPEERRSRDGFYRKLVWVVDATRRKTDEAQFREALQSSAPVGNDPQTLVRRVSTDHCRLLQEWSGSPAPIFFDFGNGPTLWWLLARRPDEPMYVAPWSRMNFIATHHGNGPEGTRDFDEFARTINGLVAPYNADARSQTLQRTPLQPIGFQYHSARRTRRRL